MPRRWKITHETGKGLQTTMIGLQTYMTNEDDVQIQAVPRHQNSKALHYVPKEAEKYLTEAGATADMTNDHGKTASHLEGQTAEIQVQGKHQEYGEG